MQVKFANERDVPRGTAATDEENSLLSRFHVNGGNVILSQKVVT
jgi:hypothetical protein